MPRISVVMPAYNAENYIKEAIDSVLGQTFSDFELIVADDGSTDSTAAIVNSIRDPRLKYHRLEKNSGTAVATNHAFDLAAGEFIANMDADDVAMPDRLQHQYEFMKEFRHISVLGGEVEPFGLQSGLQSGLGTVQPADAQIKAALLSGAGNIFNPTAMFRKEFLNKHKLACNPELKMAFDWGFFVEIMCHGGVFANLQQPLVKYRLHPSQQSLRIDAMRSYLARVRCRVLELFYPEFSLAERTMLEPMLQWVKPPSITISNVKLVLELFDRAQGFKKQSFAGEDREALEGYLIRCRTRVQDALRHFNSVEADARAGEQHA